MLAATQHGRLRYRMNSRESLLQRVDEALLSGARLVTLCGPPGIGKTHVAQLYRQLCDERPLIRLRLHGDFLEQVARALQLSTRDVEHPRQWPKRIQHHLRGRGGALLMVDGVLSGHHEELATVLSVTQVLATAHSPTGLPGEVAVEVPPLPTDEATELLGEGLEPLAERLGGHPLSLLMAAARLRVLTPEQLFERLDTQFAVEYDPLGVLASLYAVLSEAWSNLDAISQHALLQWSCFCAPFSVESTEFVSPEAVAATQQLVDMGWVKRTRGRLRVPDHLRDFCDWHRGDDLDFLNRYLGWCGHLAEAALEDGMPLEHLDYDELENAFPDADGITAARIACAVADGASVAHGAELLEAAWEDTDDPVWKGRIGQRLGEKSMRHGTPDGRWLSALSATEGCEAYGAVLEAQFSAFRHDFAPAHRHLDAAARTDDPLLRRRADRIRTRVLMAAGRFSDALPIVRRWRMKAETDGQDLRRLLYLEAQCLQDLEEADTAWGLVERAEALPAAHRDDLTLGLERLHQLMDRGEWERARELGEALHPRVRDMGWTTLEVVCQACLAFVARATGYPAVGLDYAEHALQLAGETQYFRTRLLAECSALEALRGRLPDAEARATEAEAAGADPTLLAVIQAQIQMSRGETEEAVALLAQVEASDRHRGEAGIRMTCRAIRQSTGVSVKPDRLTVGADKLWFSRAGARIELSPGGAVQRLFAGLVKGQLEDGRHLSHAAAFLLGWPDERAPPHAARHRVEVAVGRLRQLGLRGLLVADNEGYYLDADLAFVPESPG